MSEEIKWHNINGKPQFRNGYKGLKCVHCGIDLKGIPHLHIPGYGWSKSHNICCFCLQHMQTTINGMLDAMPNKDDIIAERFIRKL